jgi:hypothetical protein
MGSAVELEVGEDSYSHTACVDMIRDTMLFRFVPSLCDFTLLVRSWG